MTKKTDEEIEQGKKETFKKIVTTAKEGGFKNWNDLNEYVEGLSKSKEKEK